MLDYAKTKVDKNITLTSAWMPANFMIQLSVKLLNIKCVPTNLI